MKMLPLSILLALLPLLLLLLAGCDGMTRAEVIAAVAECEKVNMGPHLLRNGFDYAIKRVDCYPKK